MSHLSKIPLSGKFPQASSLFLESHGFKNIGYCSSNSVWLGHNIILHIEPDKVVTEYDTLFNLIYFSGMKYGKYIERKLLIDATTQFIINYKKPEYID